MIHHRSPISGVDTFAGQCVATAGYDNQLILWDAAGRRSLGRANHDHLVNQCRFSSAGDLLVSASSDYTARVWSVPALQLVAVLSGHRDDVEMAVFNPAGTRVATASRDHTVRLFDIAGRPEGCLVGHTADVISVEWINDGRELVSSSDDGTVRRWCGTTGRLLEIIDLGGIETDTIVYPGNGALYAGNDAGDVLIIRDGALERVRAHRSGIKRLVYEPSARLLLSTSYDRTIKVWSVGTDGGLTLTHETVAPVSIWLRASAFAGPSRLVFGSFGSGYASYDLDSGAWDLSLVEDTPGINAARAVDGAVYTVGDAGVVCRDGKPLARLGSLCNFLGQWGSRLVTGGHLGTLFDALTGAVLHQHWSPLNCSATFTRNGQEHLIVGAYTGEGLVFRDGPAGGIELVATLQLHDNAVKGVACNDQHIFSVCATGAAAFHAIDDLACARRIPDAHDKISNGAACLADGRFASVSRDRQLRLWTLAGVEVIPTLHDHSVKCVAVSRDGTLIATGSYDGTVALYDWRRGEWVHTERVSAFGVSSLAPADQAAAFLASSYDGTVYPITAPMAR